MSQVTFESDLASLESQKEVEPQEQPEEAQRGPTDGIKEDHTEVRDEDPTTEVRKEAQSMEDDRPSPAESDRISMVDGHPGGIRLIEMEKQKEKNLIELLLNQHEIRHDTEPSSLHRGPIHLQDETRYGKRTRDLMEQELRGVGPLTSDTDVREQLRHIRWEPMQTSGEPIAVAASLSPSSSPAQVTSAHKKRKKRKRPKDPNRPKRPPSAFLLYSETRRKDVQAAHPGHATTLVQAKIGEEWRGMNAEDKQQWMKRYDALKQIYDQETREYFIKNPPLPPPPPPAPPQPPRPVNRFVPMTAATNHPTSQLLPVGVSVSTSRLPGFSEISSADSLYASSLPYTMPTTLYRPPPGIAMLYRMPSGVGSTMGMAPTVVQGVPGGMTVGKGVDTMGSQVPLEFASAKYPPHHPQELIYQPVGPGVAMPLMSGAGVSHTSYSDAPTLIDARPLRGRVLPQQVKVPATGVDSISELNSGILHGVPRIPAVAYPDVLAQSFHDSMVHRMMAHSTPFLMQPEAYGHGMGLPIGMGMQYPPHHGVGVTAPVGERVEVGVIGGRPVSALGPVTAANGVNETHNQREEPC